jgi:hypothetical protein
MTNRVLDPYGFQIPWKPRRLELLLRRDREIRSCQVGRTTHIRAGIDAAVAHDDGPRRDVPGASIHEYQGAAA